MASGVFGLKKVYKKQVENVDNSNLTSWPEDGRYGYFIGGEQWGPPPPQITHSRTDRIDLSNETVSVSNNRTTAIKYARGISSNSDAYLLGGQHPLESNGTNLITRIDLSSETDSLPGNNLADQIYNGGVISNIDGTRGYYAGGYGPVVSSEDEIKSFDISTESITVLSATLSQALSSTNSNIRSKEYGYFASGNELPNFDVTNVNRLDLSSETVQNIPGIINPAKKDAAGTSSLQYGYLLGGQRRNPAPPPSQIYTPSTERLDFNTETFNTLPSAAQPPLNKRLMDACTNSSFGYIGGGWAPGNGPYVQYCQISRLDFSNDTVSQPGNDLSVGRSTVATVQGGQSYRAFTTKTIGYFMGGYDGGNSSYVKRMDFTSDTSSTPSMRISHATTGMRGVSSNNFGYAMGGFHGNGTPPPSTGNNRESRLHRIDFATENLTVFSATPQAHTDYTTLWGVDDMYGWKAGDQFNSPPSPVGTRSDIRRLDYSTESWYTPGTIQPTRQARGLIFSDVKNRNGITISGSGYIPTVNYNPTTFIKYQTDNDTATGTPFPALGSHQSSGSSIYNPQYGYYSGGTTSGLPIQAYSDVYRLDLSSDTYSDTTANSHPHINGIGASSNHYGYFCQGAPASPPPFALATITKFDFSTETASPAPAMSGGGDNNLGSMSNGI